MTSDTVRARITEIEAELAELRQALDEADDGGKQTRLRMLIAARRSQLADLRRRRP